MFLHNRCTIKQNGPPCGEDFFFYAGLCAEIDPAQADIAALLPDLRRYATLHCKVVNQKLLQTLQQPHGPLTGTAGLTV